MTKKLILGTWDGTVEGCECDGSIFKEICTDDQNDNGCVSLYSNSPINYTIFNSKYLCAKKSQLKYRDLLKTNQVISKEESCPSNYTFCGILDTLGNQLCVKNDESCPINTETIKNQILNVLNDNQPILTDNND